ncbi:MAG: DUF883 family protein [Oxalobacter sp.]|jgi:ElaB/YqjD/DUF883 family membrane-anchored ribosome-binding protein|nr:DUF883 family protein [Oxalobacter sp.]MBR6000505.1 DUF883 family protein [Oxalobacter sp.]
MEILENAGQAKDGIIGGLKSIVTNAEEKIAEAYESDALQGAKKKLEEAIAEAKFMLGHAEEVVVDKAKKAAVCAVEYGKEHPAKTVGLIAILGTLTGFLVARAIYKKD